MDEIVYDLLARVEALEAQVRRLTPKERDPYVEDDTLIIIEDFDD